MEVTWNVSSSHNFSLISSIIKFEEEEFKKCLKSINDSNRLWLVLT